MTSSSHDTQHAKGPILTHQIEFSSSSKSSGSNLSVCFLDYLDVSHSNMANSVHDKDNYHFTQSSKDHKIPMLSHGRSHGHGRKKKQRKLISKHTSTLVEVGIGLLD